VFCCNTILVSRFSTVQLLYGLFYFFDGYIIFFFSSDLDISLIRLNRLSLSFKCWLLKLGASFGVASSSKYSAKSYRCSSGVYVVLSPFLMQSGIFDLTSA
jgi:hypothetical protein